MENMEQRIQALVLVHSQVRRIKQEDEKIIEEFKIHMFERRAGPFFEGGRARPQRCRSPLGLAGRAISVGNWGFGVLRISSFGPFSCFRFVCKWFADWRQEISLLLLIVVSVGLSFVRWCLWIVSVPFSIPFGLFYQFSCAAERRFRADKFKLEHASFFINYP